MKNQVTVVENIKGNPYLNKSVVFVTVLFKVLSPITTFWKIYTLKQTTSANDTAMIKLQHVSPHNVKYKITANKKIGKFSDDV